MNFFVEFFLWEKCGTNLLCNTSSLTLLDVGSSDFIQKCCFTCIDMTHDYTNWTSELPLFSLEKNTIISEDALLLFLFLFFFVMFNLCLSFLLDRFSIRLFSNWSVFLRFKLCSNYLHFLFLFFGHMKSFFLLLLDSFLLYLF